MSHAALALVLSFLAFSGVRGAAPSKSLAASCDRSRTIRVLFIGNSYTYVNNAPRLVEEIAARLPGPCIESAMSASGGATLEAHWAEDSTRQRIRAGRWTFVVLQDQSSFGESWWVDGRPRVGDTSTELAEFAGRFAKVIKAANAKPVLLGHWIDDGMPIRDQHALDYAFARTARATGSGVLPVGEAIKRMRARLPEVNPYFDGHHLSPAGSYLEALVAYAMLADRSPVGAARRIEGPAVEFNQGIVYRDSVVSLVDISDSVATALQRIAAEIHSERRGKIAPVSPPPPLSAEYPRLQGPGDPIDKDALKGRWRGSSTVLPVPSKQAVAVELMLHGGDGSSATSDSVYLRDGRIEFAGPVTLRVTGDQAVIRGSVTPRSRIGRTGAPVPFTIELRGVLHAGVMSGIATMHQPGSGSLASFNAIGRFEVKQGQDGTSSSAPAPMSVH